MEFGEKFIQGAGRAGEIILKDIVDGKNTAYKEKKTA